MVLTPTHGSGILWERHNPNVMVIEQPTGWTFSSVGETNVTSYSQIPLYRCDLMMIITTSIFKSVRVDVAVQPSFTRAAHFRSSTPESACCES